MMAKQLAAARPREVSAATFRVEFRGQWPLILVLFSMQVFAFGFPTFALPFVYDGATAEFGWTRQQAVLLTSFKFYVSAAAALLVGRMLDSINPKYVVAVSALLGALAMAGFVFADQLPIYYALGVFLGLSAAGLAVAINVIVGRAFEKSIGTMLGIVLSGTSTAGVILPILMALLMERIGWRNAMAVLSGGIWLIALPAWFLLFRRGRSLGEGVRKGSFSAARIGMWDHFKGLAVTRDFWFIFAGAFLASAVDQALVQNQVLFLKSEKGLSLEMVAWGAAVLAGMGIAAKIFFGWVFDRLSILGIVLCYMLLALSVGLSFIVLGVTTMMIFMTVRGIAHGGLIVTGPVLLKHRYGTQNLGLNIGIFTLCASVGFGFGPPLMASMADKSGSYSGAFILGTAAVLAAAIFLYPVKPKFWMRR
jgi:OFA family oxalate/formate antiporter-like MFS transporter